MIRSGLSFVLVALILFSCGSKKSETAKNNPIDSVSVAQGQILFSKECSACHSFKQEGIGPDLGGITDSVTDQWIVDFVRKPEGKRWSKEDERVNHLFEKYKNPMPSFPQLTEEDFKGLLAYIHTQKKSVYSEVSGPAPLKDPIPERVALSGLVAGLELVVQLPASSDRQPLARITQFAQQPGSNDLFVVDLRGKLYKISGGKATVYMDMAKLQPNFIDKPGLATGFGSFAFHPDFASNGLLYTSHTESPRLKGAAVRPDFDFADSIKSTVQYVLSEWKTKTPGGAVFEGERRELFRISMVAGIHGVQEIAFNPTAKKGTSDYGALYIGIGDGGAVENGFAFLAHNKKQPWGTILRIDPKGTNGKNGHYGYVSDNPFVSDSDTTGNLKEIYAYGFRNPHRMSWTKDGKMLAVNVGNTHIEAIDLIVAGADYGWPIREGTFELHPDRNMSNVYPLPPDDKKYGITYPVAQYDHTDGRAITGGFEYTGSAVPAFKGKYIFGDILIGKLFYAEIADLKSGQQAKIKEWQIAVNGKVTDLKQFTGPDRVDLHFGKDARGELYILTKADGKVYKLVQQR